MINRFYFVISMMMLSLLSAAQDNGSGDSTYAEKLGYPRGAKVVVLHIDDVGMSYDQNAGTIEVLEKGAAKSCSIMMTCPWVPGFFHYLKDHPAVDAGLHLTLTSEWKDYRWGPLAGKSQVPGLVDKEGALWPSVAEVVAHASPDEVEKEIRAQIERSLQMGFRPTHMDSHMGTLFASPAFLERYVKVGLEYKIPVMFPAGHATLINAQSQFEPALVNMVRTVGRMIWNAGLPVLDDIHNTSYDLHLPAGVKPTTANLNKYKTQYYINTLKTLKPGITYMIMHCIKPTEVYPFISDSGPIREGDYLAMLNSTFKDALMKEGIIVTTMRELMDRRQRRK